MRRYRFLYGTLLAALAVMVLTVPLLAAYYSNITVTETNGTDYDMLAVKANADIDYLADNNFIEADGRDVRVKTGGGADVPFMLVTDKVLFAAPISADQSNTFRLSTGNSLIDDYAIVTGDGGYVTIADNANLELGDDFELEITGYVDTSISDDIIDKPPAFRIYSDGGGSITSDIFSSENSIIQTDTVVAIDLYGGRRAGQRLDDFPVSYITKVSLLLSKNNAPTGTAYVRLRDTGNNIIGTLGSIDVSTLSSGSAWKDFDNSVYNPATQDIRISIDYDGGDSGNYIESHRASYDTCDGYFTYFDGASWYDNTSYESTIKIYYHDIDATVSAEVSSGEHEIKVLADTTDFELYVDDTENDSVALSGASVPDLDTDFIIGGDCLPYFEYYKHTTSDTLRITYDPDDIISGTTLINETDAGTYDGTITYGSNPAGVTVAVGGLETYETSYPTTPAGSQDIIHPTTSPLFDVALDKLSHNPIQPVVVLIAEQTNLTERLVWLGGAFIMLFAVLLIVLWKTEGQITFTSFAGLGVCVIMYVVGIFPLWTIIVFAIGSVAALVWERVIAL